VANALATLLRFVLLRGWILSTAERPAGIGDGRDDGPGHDVADEPLSVASSQH
jgi:hypothetical protein